MLWLAKGSHQLLIIVTYFMLHMSNKIDCERIFRIDLFLVKTYLLRNMSPVSNSQMVTQHSARDFCIYESRISL